MAPVKPLEVIKSMHQHAFAEKKGDADVSAEHRSCVYHMKLLSSLQLTYWMNGSVENTISLSALKMIPQLIS